MHAASTAPDVTAASEARWLPVQTLDAKKQIRDGRAAAELKRSDTAAHSPTQPEYESGWLIASRTPAKSASSAYELSACALAATTTIPQYVPDGPQPSAVYTGVASRQRRGLVPASAAACMRS